MFDPTPFTGDCPRQPLCMCIWRVLLFSERMRAGMAAQLLPALVLGPHIILRGEPYPDDRRSHMDIRHFATRQPDVRITLKKKLTICLHESERYPYMEGLYASMMEALAIAHVIELDIGGRYVTEESVHAARVVKGHVRLVNPANMSSIDLSGLNNACRVTLDNVPQLTHLYGLYCLTAARKVVLCNMPNLESVAALAWKAHVCVTNCPRITDSICLATVASLSWDGVKSKRTEVDGPAQNADKVVLSCRSGDKLRHYAVPYIHVDGRLPWRDPDIDQKADPNAVRFRKKWTDYIRYPLMKLHLQYPIGEMTHELRILPVEFMKSPWPCLATGLTVFTLPVKGPLLHMDECQPSVGIFKKRINIIN